MAVVACGAPLFGAVATDNQVADPGQTTFTPTYTPSSTDLINGLSPSAQAGNFALESSGGVPVLTDGAYGSIGTGVSGAHPAFATAGNGGGTTVTYSLNTASHPAGYNLSSIVTYGGWNDSGRDEQGYTVAYSTVAASNTFIDIATVDFNPTIPASTPSATRLTITPDAGPFLGTNVAAVRFSFNTVENGYTGYAELDVFGQPSVPEPGSLGLLGAGALLLVRRRRA